MAIINDVSPLPFDPYRFDATRRPKPASHRISHGCTA
jgi:hypothetical protein